MIAILLPPLLETLGLVLDDLFGRRVEDTFARVWSTYVIDQ